MQERSAIEQGRMAEFPDTDQQGAQIAGGRRDADYKSATWQVENLRYPQAADKSSDGGPILM
jgi:hypothetical protein